MNKQELDEKIKQIFNSECTRRWKEQGIWNYCGHPMPCPKHTDIIFWKYDVGKQITKACAKHFFERIEGLPTRKGIEEKGGWQRMDLKSFVDIKKVFDSTTQDKK